MDARRAELLGHIDKTNRLQKRLAIVYGVLGLLAFVLFFIDGLTGGFVMMTLMIVAISSFWITAARNASLRRKLDPLLRQRDVRNAAV
jgi:hypothetical protein